MDDCEAPAAPAVYTVARAVLGERHRARHLAGQDEIASGVGAGDDTDVHRVGVGVLEGASELLRLLRRPGHGDRHVVGGRRVHGGQVARDHHRDHHERQQDHRDVAADVLLAGTGEVGLGRRHLPAEPLLSGASVSVKS